MLCPGLPRALRAGVGPLVLGSVLLLTACGRTADRSSARALVQPTPDRTVDAVIRGLVTVTPPEPASPTAAPVVAMAAPANPGVSDDAAVEAPDPTPARPKPTIAPAVRQTPVQSQADAGQAGTMRSQSVVPAPTQQVAAPATRTSSQPPGARKAKALAAPIVSRVKDIVGFLRS